MDFSAYYIKGSSLKIRKAVKTDRDFLIQSQIDMAMESEGMKLERETITLGVNKVFDGKEKCFYLVAETNDSPVGCLLLTEEWSDWRNGRILWIQSLYVLPQFRGKKIFSGLYNHLKQLVVQKDNDVIGLRLYVEKENLMATEIYQHLGMDGEHYNMFEWIP